MNNPLLNTNDLPDFSAVRADHVEPAIDIVLAENRQLVADLAARGPTTWDTLVAPLEAAQHRLDQVWSPVSHLNAVCNNEPLREAYNQCLAKLTDYGSELGQNVALYAAFQALADDSAQELGAAQRKVVDNALRDFRLSGVALPEAQRKQYRTLVQELSTLQSSFEENLLDATNGWSYTTADKTEVAGIPAMALQRAAEAAAAAGDKGWRFGLDFPSYSAVLTHADSSQLRERLYEAYVTRASDAGPDAGRWDNGPVMLRILELRHELATLLGFDNYASYSLATKMADSSAEVIGFLRDLAGRSHASAAREFTDLEAFAARSLKPWDVAYYSEKLQHDRHQISEEELRPWFPAERALEGMFNVVQTIFGIRISALEPRGVWHESVRLYEVQSDAGEQIGRFYVDLYARDNKRGGAWMDECIGRIRIAGAQRTPVAYLNCNFMPPSGGRPGLLTHSDVVTLFHEFGHTLHHILTRVDYPSIAGINGVPWDAVELPSQFMENFVWTPRVLPMISGHYETDAALPEEMFERLLGLRRFQAGMQMVRQLEFALFDMRIHAEYGNGQSMQDIYREVRAEVAVTPTVDYNRFANGFAHVFGGGYAAGYYSYKWAEVLSADAFAAFEEQGEVLDTPTGERFRTAVLERGGAVDALEAFKTFRGREPRLDALLRHSGIEADAA